MFLKVRMKFFFENKPREALRERSVAMLLLLLLSLNCEQIDSVELVMLDRDEPSRLILNRRCK